MEWVDIIIRTTGDGLGDEKLEYYDPRLSELVDLLGKVPNRDRAILIYQDDNGKWRAVIGWEE